jgi:hypothetical protein
MQSALELNNKMLNLIQINSQENMLLKSFEKFYSTTKYFNDFLFIINSDSKISIRLIDYFITKYSKKNKISYMLNDVGTEDNNENRSNFNIYQSYKQQLKAYQKKNFDPFARGLRIPYYIKDTWIITTIGQLNFFKWFISKNILEYVKKNKDYIEIDMNKNKKSKFDNKIKKSIKIYKKQQIKLTNNIQLAKVNNVKEKGKILVTF